MLNGIISLTNSDRYIENGGLTINEVLIKPYEENTISISLEIYIENDSDQTEEIQKWNIVCRDIMYNTSNKIHEFKIPGTQIKLYSSHPVLWNYSTSHYFSVSGLCNNIPELMGDLFIAHQKACGNWVDFAAIFSSLPETLLTQRENQLAAPQEIANTYFEVLRNHEIQYTVNEVVEGEKGLHALFFSNPKIWSDDECFGQPYLIAKQFEEIELSKSN
jgi:hypothetical protein